MAGARSGTPVSDFLRTLPKSPDSKNARPAPCAEEEPDLQKRAKGRSAPSVVRRTRWHGAGQTTHRPRTLAALCQAMGAGLLHGGISAVGEHDVLAVSYTHLRAHETRHDLVCRLLLEKKKKK